MSPDYGSGDPNRNEGSFSNVTAAVYYPGDNATYQKTVKYTTNDFEVYTSGKSVIQYHGDGFLTWSATRVKPDTSGEWTVDKEKEWQEQHGQGGGGDKSDDGGDTGGGGDAGGGGDSGGGAADGGGSGTGGGTSADGDQSGESSDKDGKGDNANASGEARGPLNEGSTGGNTGAVTPTQTTLAADSAAPAATAAPSNYTTLPTDEVATMQNRSMSLRKVMDGAEEAAETAGETAANAAPWALLLAGLVALGAGTKYGRFRFALGGRKKDDDEEEEGDNPNSAS